MWAPKRIEILSTPDVDSYSMLWLKQLVAHEYRHAVQYSNLDRSTMRVLRYIIGQQGAFVSLLFPPLYAIEGDAVMSETHASTYGRGLQPSFTIGYRAMGEEIADPRSERKLLCGSYKEHIPDHYRLGYQIMSHAYDKYNENVLDKCFWYSARNPYFILPYDIALKKYYSTSHKAMMQETMESLYSFWSEMPEANPSQEIVSAIDTTNYTTYSHPIALPDGKILALKSDYDTPSRFVEFDTKSNSERVVAYTGSVSSRPIYAAGRVWWSEYRRSLLFAEDVDSQICYMDLDDEKPRTFKGLKSALYPTPIGNSTNHLAYVDYNMSGQYSVIELQDGVEIRRIDIEYPCEIHSLAWDNRTDALYVIATSDDGMFIAKCSDGKFLEITKPAFVTINNLRAKDGVLYFGSIASGKDEIHSLDLASNKEFQLSESEYGSFQPASIDKSLYMTTYNRYGYHLAKQSSEHSITTTQWSKTPINLVNPPHKKWDMVNLDDVRFDSVAMVSSEQKYKAKRYSKFTNLAHAHSWAPVSFNPFTLISEMDLNFDLGATLISQNLLSSCDGFLSYGWDRREGSVLRAGVNYNGLGPELSLSATYGGVQSVYMLNNVKPGTYKDLNISARLPLYFQRGYRTRVVTPYAAWSYSNGALPRGLSTQIPEDNEPYITYTEIVDGLNKATIGLSYSDYVRSAYRDVDVPKGFVFNASYSTDILNSDFSQLVSFYAKLYTPGFGRNDSFTLAAGYQDAFGGYRWVNGASVLSYKSSVLTPRGYTYLDVNNENYAALSVNYQFTLGYPDVGLTPLLYFKRLRLNIGADYARFDNYDYKASNLYSYGVDLISDMNIFSMSSASSVALKLSLYKPKDRALYFQVGLELPF